LLIACGVAALVAATGLIFGFSPATPAGDGRAPEGCAAARELSEKLESPLDEVIVELEHAAVPGVGIEDELAVGESPVEVDGV
jgi:hypothetical protein